MFRYRIEHQPARAVTYTGAFMFPASALAFLESVAHGVTVLTDERNAGSLKPGAVVVVATLQWVPGRRWEKLRQADA